MSIPQGSLAPGGRRPVAGFTLLEILIAAVILAVLSAFAIPAYSSYVVRGQRASAKNALLQVAQSMERAYTGGIWVAGTFKPGGVYPSSLSAVGGTTSCVALAPIDATAHYSYCIELTVSTAATPIPAPAGGYLLSAIPCGSSAGLCPANANNSFADAQCGILSLDNAGTKYAQGANGPLATACWQK